tara:strand:+ start:9987 stop:11798 length:1812 start_codon:yes stop_codon:yes gene_type:complete
MKNILGINFGHDSAACLIINGQIINAIEEEKMSRIKQDIGWPKLAIDRILKENNLSPRDIDVISLENVFPEQLGENEILYRFTKNKYFKILEYFGRFFQFVFCHKRINVKKNIKLINKLINKNGFKNVKIDFHDHHLSHAASAFYTAPFVSDLVITSDGRGGNSSFNFYKVGDENLELLHSNSYAESVGVFYSNVTEILGFKANRHEGKITGLAAFGEDTKLVSEFKSLFVSDINGFKRYPIQNIKNLWDKSNVKREISISDKINLYTSSSSLSKEYGIRNLLLKEKMLELSNGYSKEDIAYACQKTAEDVTIQEFKRICEKYNYLNLKISLAGGVFANVRLNQLLFETKYVSNIFIHPAMNDSGIALGNAVLSDLNYSKKSRVINSYKIKNTLLGANYANELKTFVGNFNSAKITMIKMKNPAKEIATLLNNNKIIGLWNNSMEWGPRALGSRSIILNTFNKDVNQTLNDRLNRTEFMPFAPVVLDHMAKEYFPKFDSNIPAAKYMTLTYDTNPIYKEILQATVHVDGTARPQVIQRNESELYYDILDEFLKLSGCGALVNTSFNAHEEPILSSPETAINSLIKNSVDYLVMENYLFHNKLN